MNLSILTQDNIVITCFEFSSEDEKNAIIASFLHYNLKVVETEENPTIFSKYIESRNKFIPPPPYIFFIFDEISWEWLPDPNLEYNIFNFKDKIFVNSNILTFEEIFGNIESIRCIISLSTGENPKYTWNPTDKTFNLVI